ncbi:hypothetical protein ACSSS7_003858 [Eimeria intestinalis]
MVESEAFWGSKILRNIKKGLPRSDAPGAQQPTPLNLNRYVLLLLYAIQTFMTGCVYFGWAPLSAMLLKAGVFSFKCAVDEKGAYVDDQRREGENYICDEQDASVQSLYVITLAVHCTMSALAGTMMDTLGPKITSVIGQSFHLIGWSLISTLTPKSHAAVYLGFIFMGLGADTAFLPTLLVTRLFPGSAASVITLIGSASSASFAIPLILHSYLTNNGISGCWWYVGFGPCLFMVIDALIMPLKPYKVFEADLLPAQQSFQGPESPASATTPPLDQQEIHDFSPESNIKGLKGGHQTAEPVEVSSDHRFFQTVFSEKYVLVVIYFIAVGWITSFYQEAHDRILVPKARDFLGTVLPFSFIPCILLGKLAEFIGIVPVMGIVNTCGIMAYAFTLKRTAATGIISVLWFMIYMSLFVSQVFVYVEETFPSQFFGRLVGIVQLVGGLLSLLCSPLFHLTVGLGPKGLYLVQLPMIGLLLLIYFVVFRMWWIRKRASSEDKTQAELAIRNVGLTPEP